MKKETLHVSSPVIRDLSWILESWASALEERHAVRLARAERDAEPHRVERAEQVTAVAGGPWRVRPFRPAVSCEGSSMNDRNYFVQHVNSDPN